MNLRSRPLSRAAAIALSAAWLACPPLTRAQPAVGSEASLPEPRAASASGAPLVHSVSAIGITVADLDRALDFYTGVLRFEKVSEGEHAGEAIERLSGVFGARCRVARLRLGDEFIELTGYLAPEGRPIPADSRSNDRWFQHIAIVVSDMDRAYAHLRSHRVRHASSGPQRLPEWNTNAAGISAFYFKDPEGHVLEVIQFPPGKGDPRWQSATDRLFLGIDHTAIVVADTERSVAFYRDALGMTVAGGSENYGTEQEHLNHVFGARLRITTLRTGAGPGVELLEYLAPTDGRDYPGDSRACDLIHWQTVFTGAPGAAAAAVRHGDGRWVSPGCVTDPAGRTALHARDPDGHAVLLLAPHGDGSGSTASAGGR